MRRVGTLAFTSFVIAVLITISLVFVSSRLWLINLGYKISQAHREHKELLEMNRKLKIERESLRSPAQIEFRARGKLGMREPQESQIRYIR
jgi:cell division protein FtsL